MGKEYHTARPSAIVLTYRKGVERLVKVAIPFEFVRILLKNLTNRGSCGKFLSKELRKEHV